MNRGADGLRLIERARLMCRIYEQGAGLRNSITGKSFKRAGRPKRAKRRHRNNLWAKIDLPSTNRGH
jgi:hypothetical protein